MYLIGKATKYKCDKNAAWKTLICYFKGLKFECIFMIYNVFGLISKTQRKCFYTGETKLCSSTEFQQYNSTTQYLPRKTNTLILQHLQKEMWMCHQKKIKPKAKTSIKQILFFFSFPSITFSGEIHCADGWGIGEACSPWENIAMIQDP